jgi:CubicO group peptidase (beta-lactamase class C family)
MSNAASSGSATLALSRRQLLAASASLAAPAIIPSPVLGDPLFPGLTWPTATPASVGLRVEKLNAARNFATRFAGGAGCVIRDGKLVYSWGVFKQPYLIQSSTKSWGSLVLGRAVENKGVDIREKARAYLPTVGQNPSSNIGTGWLGSLTVDQLATHTGGFPFPSGYSRLEAQPGSRWIYSNCGTNWLGALLTKVYGKDLRTVTQAEIFGPLGLTANDIVWRRAMFFKQPIDGIQVTEFNGGMRANVDAMARFGYLYLNGGQWRTGRIVGASWVQLSTQAYLPRIAISTLRQHGLLWWNNNHNGMKGIPTDTFYSLGLNDNLTIVIPSLRLVIVRLGTDGWRNHGLKLPSFLQPIVDAVI